MGTGRFPLLHRARIEHRRGWELERRRLRAALSGGAGQWAGKSGEPFSFDAETVSRRSGSAAFERTGIGGGRSHKKSAGGLPRKRIAGGAGGYLGPGGPSESLRRADKTVQSRQRSG